jgi:pSer/pThr/pTyr-binding forkhead associated (FHA) protein
MPEIVVRFEEKVIERVVAEKQRLTIGRTTDNDIVLDNRGVSRRHAMIEMGPSGQAVIIDNESLNGTFVNQRKVSEEVLKDHDVISIGKYHLEYVAAGQEKKVQNTLDGTMILETKKHKKLMEADRKDRQRVAASGGGPVLVAESNARASEYHLAHDVVTLGRSNFVNVPVKGFWVKDIQAKLVPEGDRWELVNVGRPGKTKVNGEPINRSLLRNGDLIQVGRTVFRFVAGS